MMKKISVCIVCYNEEKNIEETYRRLCEVLSGLEKYDYEIIFEDNCSTDSSERILRDLASKDHKVKIILNNRNFGPSRSGKNVFFAATGDAIVSMPCDLQEPPEIIPTFVEEWEKGNLIVWGQKVRSEENGIKYCCRCLYYKIIKWISDVPQYEQTTGFGIIDQSIMRILRDIDDPDISTRHLIAELGYPVKLIPYTQNARKAGKSSYNLWRYLDFSINSLVRTSAVPLRLTTIFGAICAAISFLFGIIYLIYKLNNWTAFQAGIAPVVIAVFFLGSVQLLCIGMMGEYVNVILKKVTKRPLVTEKERINFDENRS